MPETVNLLEAAFANELVLLKKIGELEGEDLYEFVRRLGELRIRSPLGSGSRAGSADGILRVAKNIERIEESLMNFYVV